MFKQKIGIAVKISILLVWTSLFVVLLQRDYFIKRLTIHEQDLLQKAKQESFAGVFFQGERIGYVKDILQPLDDGSVRLIEEAVLNLTIMKKNYPVRMTVDAHLSAAFLLQDFHFSIASPFYKMKAQGHVNGTLVEFVLQTGKEEVRDTVSLHSAPFLSINHRSYLLKQGLQPGDKVKIAYFDPLSLSGKDTIVEYGGYEKTLVRGRIRLLHHFVEIFSGIRINSWLDDDGKVVKEESPAGFVYVREPEFKATNIRAGGRDILQSVAVPYSGDLAGLEALHEISYRLVLPDNADFDLVGGRQDWQDGILTIKKEQIPAAGVKVCDNRQDALVATPYVQSDHARIRQLARDITADLVSATDRVKAIARWVFTNLQKRPVLGIPDAVTTLELLKGDCNEHAVLFAALARSAGIPARIAAGVTFHEGAFYYHAWNEVCLNDSWLSIDTTKDQIPADVSHIRFVVGETKEQIRIGALLGRLQILPAEKQAGK